MVNPPPRSRTHQRRIITMLKMRRARPAVKRFLWALPTLLVLAAAPSALRAQIDEGPAITDDMIGQDQRAWTTWSLALSLLERERHDEAAENIERLAGMRLSDLRLALMADRTGTLRLEQAVEDGTLGEAARRLLDQIATGRRQRRLADDGWHFAAIGRFEYADANFRALVDSNPDTVALLELSRYNPARTEILIKLVTHSDVGPAAREMLRLLQEGEHRLRTDPREIEVNIERLAGPPRVVYQATNNLKASGEYAIPHLIAYLQEPRKRDLHPAIVRLLPLIGRPALNPLVVALEMKDETTKRTLVRALGEIGYQQAAPYLAKLASDTTASAEVRDEAQRALLAMSRSVGEAPAGLFHGLAEDYYQDLESLRADPRFDRANVWYFDQDDQQLRLIAVPRAIFNDIMAMRCAERSLTHRPDEAATIALWLAANFRREAKLGLDVESEHATELAERDPTKPVDYPRSIYFARAAGPLYNHLVLQRAVKDRDPGVALGAIAALAATAGPGYLVGPEDHKQALVAALSFPSRLVRFKAALALGRSLPRSPFVGSQHVVPVLAEALGQTGRRVALLVDPEGQTRNAVQGVLRAAGYVVVADERLHAGLQQARERKVSGLDAVVLASDIDTPGIAEAVMELRREFQTAAAPIVILSKPGQTVLAGRVARESLGVETVLSDILNIGDPDAIQRAVMERIADAARVLGMKSLDAELARTLALEAAHVLREMALGRSDVFEFNRAEGALIDALQHPDEPLRIQAAHALALLPSDQAQRAIARAALNETNSKRQRMAAFASLAESARLHGGLLDDVLIERVVRLAKDSEDLDLRTACSQALGALNLTTLEASDIIRTQSRG
jgi:HEAT repeat protein